LLLQLQKGAVIESPATIPSRPLLKPWYRLGPSRDGMLLEHGGSVIAFSGAAARRLLPALLPLLDGTRSVPQIVEIVGPPVATAVENALEILANQGLLTEGSDCRDVASAVRASADFCAAGMQSPPPADELVARLAGARVVVAGDGDVVEPLARLLIRSGVGELVRDKEGQTERCDLAVVAPAAASRDLRDEWNRRAQALGQPWFPVGAFDGATATIGPLVVPGETACHECLLVRAAAAGSAPAELRMLRRVPSTVTPPPWLGSVVAGVAAHQIVSWIALRSPAVPGMLTAVETRPRLAITNHVVLRVPRCPVCAPSSGLALPAPWHEARSA
jgi:bacteriocin biosynthesis cyclodehydratase domain-containing protein